MQPRTHGTTDEEASAAFHAITQQLNDLSISMMAAYKTNHAAEALFLHDQFVRMGVTDGSERTRFEYPTNPLGVEHIARELGTWAK